jgi:hypothetical protein
MQDTTLVLLAVSLALGAGACAGNNADVPPAKPGSYATVPVNDDQVMAAARFAVDAQQKAVSTEAMTATLELVSVLAAEQQVVAGVNYRVKLRVKHDGVEKTVDAVVWWQAWRRPDAYQLTSWTWR